MDFCLSKDNIKIMKKQTTEWEMVSLDTYISEMIYIQNIFFKI